MKGMALSVFGFLLPVMLMLQLLVSSAPREIMVNMVGSDMAEAIAGFMVGIEALYNVLLCIMLQLFVIIYLAHTSVFSFVWYNVKNWLHLIISCEYTL